MFASFGYIFPSSVTILHKNSHVVTLFSAAISLLCWLPFCCSFTIITFVLFMFTSIFVFSISVVHTFTNFCTLFLLFAVSTTPPACRRQFNWFQVSVPNYCIEVFTSVFNCPLQRWKIKALECPLLYPLTYSQFLWPLPLVIYASDYIFNLVGIFMLSNFLHISLEFTVSNAAFKSAKVRSSSPSIFLSVVFLSMNILSLVCLSAVMDACSSPNFNSMNFLGIPFHNFAHLLKLVYAKKAVL